MWLTIVTMLTLPLTVSKYVASGTVNSSARVAKWNVTYNAASPAGGTTIYYDGVRDTATAGTTHTFTINLNDTEVMTEIVLKPTYTNSSGAEVVETGGAGTPISSITSSPAGTAVTDTGYTWRWRYPIGTTAITYTVTVQNVNLASLTKDNCGPIYTMKYDAIQVD